jgi:hypothetical protein
MAYTVKRLAAMSGVTVRTLHFYDYHAEFPEFTAAAIRAFAGRSLD